MHRDLNGVRKRRSTYLPHWEQQGGVNFVTYRLADSLPAAAVAELKAEREALERKLGFSGIEAGNELARFNSLRSKRIETLLDNGHGECLLANNSAAQIVRDNLLHFSGRRYELLCWCVMPNHVHVLIRPLDGWGLEKIVHGWKSYTAKQINRLQGRTGTVWQAEYFDRLIRNRDELRRGVQYILENPVKAGLGPWKWVDVSLDSGF